MSGKVRNPPDIAARCRNAVAAVESRKALQLRVPMKLLVRDSEQIVSQHIEHVHYVARPIVDIEDNITAILLYHYDWEQEYQYRRLMRPLLGCWRFRES